MSVVQAWRGKETVLTGIVRVKERELSVTWEIIVIINIKNIINLKTIMLKTVMQKSIVQCKFPKNHPQQSTSVHADSNSNVITYETVKITKLKII